MVKALLSMQVNENLPPELASRRFLAGLSGKYKIKQNLCVLPPGRRPYGFLLAKPTALKGRRPRLCLPNEISVALISSGR